MKKEEKQVIYNLLKTTDAYLNGYERKCFSGEPVFQDDGEQAVNAPDGRNAMQQTVGTPEGAVAPQQTVGTPDGAVAAPKMEEGIRPENVEGQRSGGISMEELNSKILRCTRCGLAATRHNVVPGEGVPHPDVLVVGEGPGYDEDMQGHPFVGRAGILLDKMLHAINLDRHTNVFIGNIIKCRPPENRNPFPDEEAACFPFLETQIHILKPKMILCLGKVAIEKLMNQSISITANHGVFYDYNGIPTMVTYHPSALLRNQELKRPAWEDLKGFRRRLDEILNNNPGGSI